MRRVRYRRATCKTGKKCWATEAVASLRLLAVQNERREQGDEKTETRTYRCPYCSFWHLTSMTPKQDEKPK